MANNQFLESQRLQMMDMRRLESVLTEEQQRQVEVLQREDQQREEQERRIRDLEEKRSKLDQEVEKDLRREVSSSLSYCQSLMLALLWVTFQLSSKRLTLFTGTHFSPFPLHVMSLKCPLQKA